MADWIWGFLTSGALDNVSGSLPIFGLRIPRWTYISLYQPEAKPKNGRYLGDEFAISGLAFEGVGVGVPRNLDGDRRLIRLIFGRS